MKYSLPDGHALADSVIADLIFKEEGKPALSDVQYAALEAGVGRGESVLVVSPTSTGKTQIALWAIVNGIRSGHSTVYLVNYRALARQKLLDFKSQLLGNYLGNDTSSLVIATGDCVEDIDGNIPKDPLRAPVLVATYEKYLAMLSASGVPSDMRTTTVVCDEIQLVGDSSRGQNVEILLTFLRNAGWRQFVGLSAVLESKDARELAAWLNVKLVEQHTREKHLSYECWSHRGIAAVNSARPDMIEEGLPIPAGVELDPISILASLLKQKAPPTPIIVFCMRKQDTYDLAERFLGNVRTLPKGQLSLAFDGLPATSANEFLSRALENRVASHNADLMDEEREVVESYLLGGKLDVVFATTTLAAGVNFPLGAAIFATWSRWDGARRVYVPIDTASFHNMAGRVGRMGLGHESGRVIFLAKNEQEARSARGFLDFGAMPSLEPRIATERFNQLALQLVASRLCESRSAVQRLICTTLSALREQERNVSSFANWPKTIDLAIDSLVREGLLMQTSGGHLSATPVGRALGHSGLVPETGLFLVDFIATKVERLISALPTRTGAGDDSRFAFAILAACLSSPEFRPQDGKQPTRSLAYQLDKAYLFDAGVYRDDLVEPNWQADVAPINGARLCLDWMDGAELRGMESKLPQLSAGMLRDMFRNVVWILQGLASILTSAADGTVPADSRPLALRSNAVRLDLVARLPRAIRRLSFRVAEGLPDDLLWMPTLNASGAPYRLNRAEMLALKRESLATPERVMLGSPEADTIRAKVFLAAKPSAFVKANWLRDTCRTWKQDQRKRAAERHSWRARRCKSVALVDNYYNAIGTDFEVAFEQVLSHLGIAFARLDDRTKTGAPDYHLTLDGSRSLIVELKSKQGDKLVDYNKAVEVLAASEIHGHKGTFCVTLCQPGVDPSVPAVILACARLCVVESSDLGEAFLRICEGTLTQCQLWRWLSTPGQALSADLPYAEYEVSS